VFYRDGGGGGGGGARNFRETFKSPRKRERETRTNIYFCRRIARGLNRAQFRTERFRRDAYITGIGRADFFQIYLAGGQHAETACLHAKPKTMGAEKEKKKEWGGEKKRERENKEKERGRAYVRPPLHKVITQA